MCIRDRPRAGGVGGADRAGWWDDLHGQGQGHDVGDLAEARGHPGSAEGREPDRRPRQDADRVRPDHPAEVVARRRARAIGEGRPATILAGRSRDAAAPGYPSAVARLPAPVRALPADMVGLRAALLAWFDRNGRALAFRFERDPDPWAVLVSEVMAQQTQVARVAEKWRAFMGRFPTPAALASAPTGDVIRAWQGLGYNRRAIDLQQAARAIVVAGGRVPELSLIHISEPTRPY